MNMKIAIVTNFFYPDRLGGTELYCHQLANALLNLGHQVYWFVPNFNEKVTLTIDGENNLKIIKFAAIDKTVESSPVFVASSFIKEMQERNITVAHFNEFGGLSGVSEFLLKETKKAGITTVVTLHLAHYVCQAGTMRFGGKDVCNGEVIPNRCGSCNLFSNATSSESVNYLLTRVFNKVFDVMDKNDIALLPKIKRLLASFKLRLSFIAILRDHADTVVALAEWFKEVLILNGIPENKVVYLPQAIPSALQVQNVTGLDNRKNYVFIGRINKEKGIMILLGAAKKLSKQAPGVDIDLYGPMPIPLTKQTKYFLNEIKKLSNIHYKGVLKPAEVLSTIDKYKAVLLPSHVAEMAPLIIMEANALKIPVIVSDVPGSVELVKQEDSGLVFNYDDVDDLVKKMLLIENGIAQFQFNKPFENDFDHTALQYIALYNKRALAVSA
jgi:glycosyltransferase involved in cell wall biosynthesis